MLFYVWEDARVWAYWHHPFDTHLNSLGARVLLFSTLNLLREHSLGHWSGWWPHYPLFTDMHVTYFVHITLWSVLAQVLMFSLSSPLPYISYKLKTLDKIIVHGYSLFLSMPPDEMQVREHPGLHWYILEFKTHITIQPPPGKSTYNNVSSAQVQLVLIVFQKRLA